MGSQPPALEKLFDEWAKKHAEKLSTAAPYFMPEQEQPYGGFVRDGIVNLDSWKKQKVRICFVLNEAGGRIGMEHYPEGHDLAAEWNERGSFSKFMFKLAVWTQAIRDAFNPPGTYSKAEVSKIRDELIRSIAVVNIKKSDGQRRSDYKLLQNFASEDYAELRRELEIVNPNVIVFCENFKILHEPLPHPKKKKPAETTDTTVTDAETPEVESAETETVETPAEDVPRNYVLGTKEIAYVSKFAFAWGNKLLLSMWTPANFVGTLSSNTINYYAVRGVVRAALKAFGERQRKAKVTQMQEQKHQERVAAAQAKTAPAEPAAAPEVPKKTAAKAATAEPAEKPKKAAPKTKRTTKPKAE